MINITGVYIMKNTMVGGGGGQRGGGEKKKYIKLNCFCATEDNIKLEKKREKEL